MHPSTLLAVLATLTPVTIANWTPDRATQINFYTDTKCTAYAGETSSYFSRFPHVGYIGSTIGAAKAECWNINMPGNAKSLNTANIWGYTTSTTTPPGSWSGRCDFNDGLDCKGNNWGFSGNPINYDGSNTCLAARSKDGWLWKSAKCYV